MLLLVLFMFALNVPWEAIMESLLAFFSLFLLSRCPADADGGLASHRVAVLAQRPRPRPGKAQSGGGISPGSQQGGWLWNVACGVPFTALLKVLKMVSGVFVYSQRRIFLMFCFPETLPFTHEFP